MLTRRDLLYFGAFGMAVAPFCSQARATPAEIGTREPLAWPDVVPTMDEAEFEINRLTGGDPAYKSEIAFANTLLDGAPTNARPMDVATYFLEIGLGDKGAEAADYVEEWPVRWNPVIIKFWQDGTTDRSKNDVANPWCAAFVNYCLLKARVGRPDADQLLKPTKSAASSSFRNWGTATDMPEYGDIVVFEDLDDF